MAIEIGLKFYIYQIIGVLVIWLGMTWFRDDIHGNGQYIYYAVTSWLLFLIVITIKKYVRDKKEKQDS